MKPRPFPLGGTMAGATARESEASWKRRRERMARIDWRRGMVRSDCVLADGLRAGGFALLV